MAAYIKTECRVIFQPRTACRLFIPECYESSSTMKPLQLAQPAAVGGQKTCVRCGARYTNVFVGAPSHLDDYVVKDITPQQCRLRNMTYSAPITVDLEYTRGKEIVIKKGGRNPGEGAVLIGHLPLMLRSDRCAALAHALSWIMRHAALEWSWASSGPWLGCVARRACRGRQIHI